MTETEIGDVEQKIFENFITTYGTVNIRLNGVQQHAKPDFIFTLAA